MEILICRILMASGLLAGVLLATDDDGYTLAPALLALVSAGVLRRIAPSLPWHLEHTRWR